LLGDAVHPWRHRIDWRRLHLFWGDERHVPPEHPDSNYGMAKAALVDRVPVPLSQVHRMRGEIVDAQEGADQYEHTIRRALMAAGRHDMTFDVMLLGLGEDAHIASIFPGSPLLDKASIRGASLVRLAPHESLVAAVWAQHLNAWRITLTPAALLDARATVVLVSGASKAGAVRAALQEPEDVRRWPAQLLRAGGDRVEWFMDSAAARWHAAPPA
jgi:6-phosphogluconolactonase